MFFAFLVMKTSGILFFGPKNKIIILFILLLFYFIFMFIKCPPTHFASNRRWGGPCTSRGTWPRTRCSAPPAGRCPTAGPRTRSSRWGRWPSRARSCGAWWSWWGKSGPAASSCTRAFSRGTKEQLQVWWWWVKGSKLYFFRLFWICTETSICGS